WAAGDLSDALLQAMLASGTAYAPALESLFVVEPPHELGEDLKALGEPGWLSRGVAESLQDWPTLLRYARERAAPGLSRDTALRNLQRVRAAGVPVALASFSGLPGLPQGIGLRAELG